LFQYYTTARAILASVQAVDDPQNLANFNRILSVLNSRGMALYGEFGSGREFYIISSPQKGTLAFLLERGLSPV